LKDVKKKKFPKEIYSIEEDFKGEIISKKQISRKKQISEKISKKFVEETNFSRKS
jgi:hypothetical protein